MHPFGAILLEPEFRKRKRESNRPCVCTVKYYNDMGHYMGRVEWHTDWKVPDAAVLRETNKHIHANVKERFERAPGGRFSTRHYDPINQTTRLEAHIMGRDVDITILWT